MYDMGLIWTYVAVTQALGFELPWASAFPWLGGRRFAMHRNASQCIWERIAMHWRAFQVILRLSCG